MTVAGHRGGYPENLVFTGTIAGQALLRSEFSCAYPKAGLRGGVP